MRTLSVLAAGVLAALPAGCNDPGALPRVNVTVRGLSAIVANTSALPDAVSVWLYTRRATDGGIDRADASGPFDTRTDSNIEDRRVASWNRTDPFEFPVQLPASRIVGAQVLVTVDLLCGGQPTPVIVARGSHAAFAPFTPGGTDAHAIELTAEPVPFGCP